MIFNVWSLTGADIDECDERNICGAPGHVCVNTPGSYTCVPGAGEQCPAGFKPSPREDTPCQGYFSLLVQTIGFLLMFK